MKRLSVAQLMRSVVIAVGFVLAVSVWACETAEPTRVAPTAVDPTSTAEVVVRVEPTVTPTSEVIETAISTATSTPSPTRTPEPSPTPTAVPMFTLEPTATATMVPTNTPTATIVVPTSTPTNTPEPTETPVPTATSTPEAAPTPQPTSTPLPEPTVTATPTVEPSPTPQVVVVEPDTGDPTPIDTDPLWGELFDTLGELEVSCIQTSLDEEEFHAISSRSIVSSQIVPDRHELAVWRCLSQANAIDLYISQFLTLGDGELGEVAGLEGADACFRSVLKYADIARYIESTATDDWFAPNEGRVLMAYSLARCAGIVTFGGTEIGGVSVNDPRPINLAPNLEVVWGDLIGAMWPDEESCIRDELGPDRYEAFLHEGVFDGASQLGDVAVWGCLRQEMASAIFQWAAPFENRRQGYQVFAGNLSLDGAACLDRVLANMDFPRFIRAGLPDVDLDDYRHGLASIIGVGLCVGFLPAVHEQDDHGDGVETATAIAIGTEVNGAVGSKFSAEHDLDVFSFVAAGGLVYEIDFAADERAGAEVYVYSRDGRVLVRTRQSVLWEPADSGSYLLVVRGLGTGSYDVSVTISDYVDDHGDDRGSATSMAIDRAVDGAIGIAGERDYFEFAAEGDVAYQIDAVLSDSNRPGIDNEDLELRLLDAEGNRLSGARDRRIWRAPGTGIYFFEVWGRRPGTYTIRFSVSSYEDDHGDDFQSATEISTVGETTGVIGTDADEDFFSFVAEAGDSFEMEVVSPTDEKFYLELVDATDDPIAHVTEPLTWQAVSTGRYYARIWSPGIGEFTLAIRPSDYTDDHVDDQATEMLIGVQVDGHIAHEGDLDPFAFMALEGQTYDIGIDLGTVRSINVRLYDSNANELRHSSRPRMTWQAPASGIYYLYLQSYSTGTYSLTVSHSDYMDDHGDTRNFATAVDLGETVKGVIGLYTSIGSATDNDHDMFGFVTERGQMYSIDVELGSLLSSRIRLFDAAGDVQESADTRIVWEAARSGRHYVQVSGTGIGDYALTIDRIDYTNDHGDDISSATPIQVGDVLSGAIGLENESDYFRFASTEGEAYQIDLIPDRMEFPRLRLVDADGNHLGSAQLRLKARAVASKEFYIVVSSSFLGEYRLELKLAR